MKVYVAGPYTRGDVAENVHRAMEVGDFLLTLGMTPYVPHLTHFWHLMFPRRYEEWMELDMEWLKECDAVVRLEGASEGADREVSAARGRGIPVYRMTGGLTGEQASLLERWLMEQRMVLSARRAQNG